MVQAVHITIRGRARYKVKGLYRSEPLKKWLESRLSEVEGLHQVSASVLTGTVPVVFNSNDTYAGIASLIQEVVAEQETRTQEKQTEESKQAEPGDLNGRASIPSSHPMVHGAVSARAERQQVEPWHRMEPEKVLASLDVRILGLPEASAKERLRHYGANLLPEATPRFGWDLFCNQFKSGSSWNRVGKFISL